MRCRMIVLVARLGVTAPVSAQLENVGSLSFPTSAKPEAQRYFLKQPHGRPAASDWRALPAAP